MTLNRPSPLGLYDASDPPSRVPASTPLAHSDAESSRAAAVFELSVILPARNEEAVLPGCLRSLLAQHDQATFALGRDWEILVIDDDSADSTHALAAEAFAGSAGTAVVTAPAVDFRAPNRGFTGKTNACWFGAQQARGRWLLFTDADTLHEPGNLLRALHEARKHSAALLSYSPRQIVTGLAQRTVMPLIFSELASVYPMTQVNDPGRRLAAANGQFLLIEREAYFAVGGHRMVGRSVLEDVELAHNVKRSKRNLRFRYAPDALSTRMYRGFGDMVEGWTKNLVLLFPHALSLAAWRALDILLLLLPLLFLTSHPFTPIQKVALFAIWGRTLYRFYARVARSNFPLIDCVLSVFGLPLFIALLLRSYIDTKLLHQVKWKGRAYRT